MPQDNRLSVYDIMDKRGVFATNPANAGAKDKSGKELYKGPVRFPKMLYHPKGETRVLTPGDRQQGFDGVFLANRQVEIINRIVETPEEEAELLAAGWHRTPREAMIARGDAPGGLPPEPPEDKIAKLSSEADELKKQLAAALADKAAAERKLSEAEL